MFVRIKQQLCLGCGTCLLACPNSAIKLVKGHATINPALCRGCGECISACPAEAIEVVHTSAAKSSGSKAN